MFGEPEVPGRRLEIVRDAEGRPDLNLCLPEEPGDYVGPIQGYTGAADAVFFKLPVAGEPHSAGVRHVCSPPHEFVENEDGTLTINPSILAVRSGGDAFHGYLTEGRWKEV